MTNTLSNRLKAIEQTSGRQFMSLRAVEKITNLLDSKFKIPGTKISFGLDPILGLIPVLGDAISYLVSGLLIFTMYRHGANKRLVIRMTLNSTLDALIGSIPVFGTIFDIWFKSNKRNLKLLQEYYFERKHKDDVDNFDKTALIFCAGLFASLLYMVVYFYTESFMFFGS